MPHRLSFEGDPVEAQRLLGVARQELDRLRARLATTGLDFGKFVLGFPGTSNYCYGHILPGGVEQIHIITTPGATSVEPLEDENLALPDFLSGYAIDGRIDADAETGQLAALDFRPTAACAALHHDEVSIGPNRVERLALEVGPGFSGYFPDRGTLPRSQSDLLYPTCYSGSMRRWVQLMHGFGKKPEQTSIYDDVEPEIIDDETHIQTAWERKLISEGMRIWYDFRFTRTHGIHFASDGKPWLVEISMNRGVVAMPLPIDYRTTTEDFRLKLENLGDTAGLQALDDFGGFPSGEPFPSTGDLWNAYERAGRIITLAEREDLEEFYQHLQYSSAMGWAFSQDGIEAHNTAYRYGDDGVQVGVHWAVQMQIGAMNAIDPADNAIDLKNELSEMAGHAMYDPVIWKIDRFTEDEISEYLRRLGSEPVAEVFEEINALVMDPLAAGSCSAKEAGSGFLWWPTEFQPQIKFYEPQLGYLLSHDLRPDRGDAPRDPYCDTTVHVFFAGNELKWAKYFLDARVVDGGYFGDDIFICQHTPQGRLYRYYRSGPWGVPAQYYTNDIDIRAERGESQTDYFYDGTPIGWVWYGNHLNHWTEPQQANFGIGDKLQARAKLFFKELNTVAGIYRNHNCAVVVPAWFRESMLVATLDDYYDAGSTLAWGYQLVVDPNQAIEKSNDGDDLIDVNVFSNRDTVDPVYAVEKDFADEGTWIFPGDEFKTSGGLTVSGDPDGVIFTPGVRTKRLEVTLIAANDNAPVVTNRETRSGDPYGGPAAIWEPKWFLPSPYPDTGDTQFHHATANSYGDSSCLIHLDDLDGSENVTIGSPQDADFSWRLPVFIGVV